MEDTPRSMPGPSGSGPRTRYIPHETPGFTLNGVDTGPPTSRPGFYGVMLAIAIIWETALTFTVALSVRSHVWVLALIWACLVALSFLYKSGAVHEARDQQPGELQRSILILKSRVPLKAVRRLLTDFRPDPRTPDVLGEQILLMTRRHKFMLIRQIVGIVLLEWALLTGFLWLRFHPVSLPSHLNTGGTADNSPGYEIVLPGWILLLVIGVGLLAIGMCWLSWNSYYLIVTKTGFVLQRIYSPFFFWLPTFKKELPRRKIDVTEYRKPFLARLLRLDYGANMSDTAAQGDKAFNALDGFPDPAEIRRLLFAPEEP